MRSRIDLSPWEKAVRYLLALSIVLTLAGCYSDHSLATLEQAVFDERLLGNWLFPGSEDGSDITEIVVFNKADRVDEDTRMGLRGLESRALFASSRTGEGITALRTAIEDALPLPAVEIRALVPYDRGDLVSAAHESGHIVSQTHEAGGTALHAHVSERLAAELAPFQV